MATQCQQLFDLLVGEGMHVELAQTNAPYRPAWIARVPLMRALFRLIPYFAALYRMARRVEVIHLLANSGWSWHLFAAPAVWIARVQGVPVIVNYRGGDAERFLKRAPRWVTRTLGSADACVVPSGFLRDVLAKFGVASEIIPNVVDLSRFRPRAPGARAESQHVIVTRNLEAIYDIATGIRAFALVSQRFPNVRFTVVGEGPERDTLMRLARELRIDAKISFPGRLTREAMAALYREADVMLNPSLIDNMPNSILEAYASGVPIVSTNVGGIPYIARDNETAMLVAPGDAEAMAERICSVLGHPNLAHSLAAQGRLEASRYSWPEIRTAWLTLYRRLATAGGLVPGHR